METTTLRVTDCYRLAEHGLLVDDILEDVRSQIAAGKGAITVPIHYNKEDPYFKNPSNKTVIVNDIPDNSENGLFENKSVFEKTLESVFSSIGIKFIETSTPSIDTFVTEETFNKSNVFPPASDGEEIVTGPQKEISWGITGYFREMMNKALIGLFLLAIILFFVWRIF